jgi:hypothetical protein
MNAMVAPLEGVTPRVQEIGRIRMGEKSKSGYPVKLKTFRLTSNDRKVLEAAVALYGGEVKAWSDAPDEGMWQVTTAASELDILIPRALRAVSQSWELWQGGTCERRCDGRTEQLSGSDCICGPARGSSDEFCDVVTRLSVVLPRLPGLGVWRLDSGGWNAATTIPATLDFMLALDPRPMVPAVLRAVQASSKVRGDDGKVTTHRFVRPQLDAPGITIGQLVGSGIEPVAQLDAGEQPSLPTAEERVARRRAEVEAQKAGDVDQLIDGPVETSAERQARRQAELAALGISVENATAKAKAMFPDHHGTATEVQWQALLAVLREPPVAADADTTHGDIVEPEMGF